MTVQIENENKYSFDFPYEDVARRVIEQVLTMEQCPYEAEINLVLTGSEEIREINRQFRGIDRETDVLSFPMQDFPAPAEYDFLENEESFDAFHPDTGELMLGDIMISVPRAIEQAEQFGHGLMREYAFLIAHSMLHLLGYDHMEPDEARIMEAKQAMALEALGITR